MRTLEFGAYPTQTQTQQLEGWLLLHRKLWNYGLALLEELHAFTYYDKLSGERVPCCPVPWQYRWQKAPDDTWQTIPYSEVRRHRKAGLSCPLPQDHRQPRLTGDSYMALSAFFAKRNHPNWPELQGCPSAMLRGTLKALATAWVEYRKGKRRQPRFKSDRFPIATLSDLDCKKSASVDGNTAKLPVLGLVKIRGNNHGNRWPSDRVICTYRLQREPSGWFLLLVGEAPSPTMRATQLRCGLDAGVVHTLTTDNGRHIDGPKALTCNLRKLEQLQQQMARQSNGGANWRKTVQRIAALHEKIRRTRKAFAHQQTTYLLRTYATVAIEDLNHGGMARRAKPKPKEDGTGFKHNGAAAKSGLNRSLRDAGIGTLFTMLEAKAQERGRTVVRVNPAHTSQTCSHCGAIDKASRLSQSLYRCTSCGHTMNADHNAALNVLARAT